MKVVAVYNVKGGVGKTAIALNLAHASVAARHRTLLWDLDEQGGSSTILGRPPTPQPRRVRRTYHIADHIGASHWPGLDLVPADALLHLLDRHDRPKHLRELLAKIDTGYDRIVIDCPPTLGIVAEQIFELADLVVVPIVPSVLAMAAWEQLQAHVASRDSTMPEFLPVLSMVDRRRRAHREAAEAEPNRIVIPYAAAMEAMATTRQPVAVGAPRSPAVAPLAALARLVERRLRPKGASANSAGTRSLAA